MIQIQADHCSHSLDYVIASQETEMKNENQTYDAFQEKQNGIEIWIWTHSWNEEKQILSETWSIDGYSYEKQETLIENESSFSCFDEENFSFFVESSCDSDYGCIVTTCRS